MNEKEFNNFIHFSDQKDYIENHLWNNEWITVYQKKKLMNNGYIDDICFYSCLVSKEIKDTDNDKDSSWIHSMDSGKPRIVECSVPLRWIDRIKKKLFSNWQDRTYIWPPEQLKKWRTKIFKIKSFFYCCRDFLVNYKTQESKEYKRFYEAGIEQGIEPLVHVRHFERGNYPSYIEISEEFRLYFNLYEKYEDEDHKNKIFLSDDENSNSIEVIKIIDNNFKDKEVREVKIKKTYLNEFLYVKKMWLCVQFSNGRWVTSALKKNISKSFSAKDGNFIYSLNSYNQNNILNSDNQGNITCIIFMGRKFIKYKNIKSLHYEREKKYEEFSFIDENGDEKSWTCEETKLVDSCEENKLADCFGKNPEPPNYLTPISFRKDVLKKYYDKPSQYSVWYGYLICERTWKMRVDIQDNRVVVSLGELSRLPYLEQHYWKSYNITDKTEINRPDFLFKKHYKEFNKKWEEKYGWPFFKLLSYIDQDCFYYLRIPLNEEQSEFDNQINCLVTIFIESINTKKIKKEIPKKYRQNSESPIEILNMFLKSKDIENANQMIDFLKNLYKLRSKGSAHIKDKDYEKTLNYFKTLKAVQKPESKIHLFSDMLVRCTDIINILKKVI